MPAGDAATPASPATDGGRHEVLHRLIAALQAADEDEDPKAPEVRPVAPSGTPYLPPRAAPAEHHLLEQPLQVCVRFEGRPAGEAWMVDVLAYGQGGRELSLALPPELEVAMGMRGELTLPAAGCSSEPGGAGVAFTLVNLEPSSMLRLGQVVIHGVDEVAHFP